MAEDHNFLDAFESMGRLIGVPATNPPVSGVRAFAARKGFTAHKGVLGGDQWRFEFANGYGASVVRHRGNYGGFRGLFELAVFKDGGICYDTPITSDVLGHLSEEEVLKTLDDIEALPAEVQP